VNPGIFAIMGSRGGNFRWTVGAANGRGDPFGFAQGRLSTSFGWRLTSLKMQS